MLIPSKLSIRIRLESYSKVSISRDLFDLGSLEAFGTLRMSALILNLLLKICMSSIVFSISATEAFPFSRRKPKSLFLISKLDQLIPKENSMKELRYSESGLNLSSQVDMILYKTCILMGLVRDWAGSCLLRCLRDMRSREKKWFLMQLSLLDSGTLTCPRRYAK